jgi:hypothetical protein
MRPGRYVHAPGAAWRGERHGVSFTLEDGLTWFDGTFTTDISKGEFTSSSPGGIREQWAALGEAEVDAIS